MLLATNRVNYRKVNFNIIMNILGVFFGLYILIFHISDRALAGVAIAAICVILYQQVPRLYNYYFSIIELHQDGIILIQPSETIKILWKDVRRIRYYNNKIFNFNNKLLVESQDRCIEIDYYRKDFMALWHMIVSTCREANNDVLIDSDLTSLFKVQQTK